MRRAPINEWLATGGRPQQDNVVADVYVILRKAGMPDSVVAQLANLISDTRAGYDWRIKHEAGNLERALRLAHSDKHTNGMWARLLRRHGPGALYLDIDSAEARAWAE